MTDAMTEGHSGYVYGDVAPAVLTTDPALAVERALSADEAAAFESMLTGRWQGSTPSDYISAAYDADAHLSQTEPWWEEYSDTARARLAARLDLHPDSEHVTALLGASLLALVVIGGGEAAEALPSADAVADLAERAGRFADTRVVW